MNYLSFLLPLLQELVQVVGPTVLDEINKAVGGLAQQHNVPLTTTPQHTIQN